MANAFNRLEYGMKGTKLVEVPYFLNQITDVTRDILIIGECKGGKEGISESIHGLGCINVTTTDILQSLPDSWLRKNTNWEHIKTDFIKFDETRKFDYIIAISVFEHFGMFWEGKAYDVDSDIEDMVLWNHDIRGILKACKLLKDEKSKLIITLPIGPYMNYKESGYPFLRYYDQQRQNIIKKTLIDNNYRFSESFFISTDAGLQNWQSVDNQINHMDYYRKYCNIYTPNIIWGLTIQL